MSEWITGAIGVKAAVMAGNRSVERVLLDKEHRRELNAFANRAKGMGISITWTQADAITAEAGEGHQGAAALVGPRQLLTVEALFSLPEPRIVLLHGVEDPYNFGHAIRSLYAAGVTGVLLPPRNWSTASALVARASAGAAEWMPMAAADPYEAVLLAKSKGFRFLCADKVQGAEPLFSAPLHPPLLLAVGGEKRGLNKQVTGLCDGYVEIPYGRGFPYALSTDGAAAVVGFELLRRKGSEKEKE